MQAGRAVGSGLSTRARSRVRARGWVVAALTATGALLLLPSVAGAQQVQPYGGGSTVVTDPAHDQSSQSASVPAPDTDTTSSLPFTGGDVAGLAAIGAGALGVGLVVSRARRGAPTRS